MRAFLIAIMCIALTEPASAACCANWSEFAAWCRSQGGTPAAGARCYPASRGGGSSYDAAAALRAAELAQREAKEREANERKGKADEADQRGNEAANRGDWSGAVNQYIAALQFAPDSPEIRAHLARANEALADAGATTAILALQQRSENAIATANIQALQQKLENESAERRLNDLTVAFRRSRTAARLVAVVPLQIAGIQNALRQLNKSLSLDASQRQEWERASERATRDAKWMAASATLDLAGAVADEQIGDTETDIKEAVRLHRARRALRGHLADLQNLRGAVSKVHDAFDVIHTANTIDDETSEPEIEAIWKLGEKLKIISPTWSASKSIIDATYLIWVQADSVLRIKQINRNQDRYLAALRVLKARMEAAVKASKDLAARPQA